MEQPKAHMRRTRAFLVQMSNKVNIPIDEEELDKVVEGISSGNVILVKNGLVNPSFVVNIVKDKDRIEAWLSQCNDYGEDYGRPYKLEGLKPLKSIFGNTKVGKLIAERENKLLES